MQGKQDRILPETIYKINLTNKAANEMRQRIYALFGDNDMGYINNLHGFLCFSFVGGKRSSFM